MNTPGYSSNTKATKGTVNATQQQKEFYTYDPVGNRLTSDRTRNYTYNQGNQLTTNNGSYTYDRNGNLIQKVTSDGTTTYAWDYENRLVKVTTPTTTAAYAYDPFGRRIEKKVTESGATTTTRYFYDNQAILFEYDENGTIGNRYLHGPGIDEPLTVTTGKDKYYYHADGLGSIIALTDTGGKVVQSYEYDSFGNLKDQKNRVKQPFTYTGREWDKETGLYYYRARYYDPIEGRFISKDPIGFVGGDVVLYGYVQNNPIDSVDPFGLFGSGGPKSSYPGHADFTGSWSFDYNLEDSDYTRPLPGIGDPERHFRDVSVSDGDVANAITSCNKEKFARAMHRGQDYFSHYSKGYRWKPGDKTLPCRGYGHGCVGTKPDEDISAWKKAEKWTNKWFKKWLEKCSCKK